MKKITFTYLIVLLVFIAGEACAQNLASRVLVVKNTKSPVSIAIADDYMKRRNVTNVVNITCPDDAHDQDAESINYPDYLTAIEAPLLAYLKLHTNIDFIVFTKGIPIRIYNTPDKPYGGVCSLDSRISTLGYENSNTSSIIKVSDPNYGSDYVGNSWANKYWNSEARFTHTAFGGYLVTRLDGYTQADAIALTTRSLEAEKNWRSGNNSRGPILLDACGDFGFTDKGEQPYTLIPANHTPGDTIYITHESIYAEYNSDMTVANDYLVSKKIPVLYDTAPDFVGHKTNLQGYISWGSNDSHYDATGYNALKFSPGAIAETAVSTSARTFLPTEGGQSLIDDLVSQGVTGAKGYTDEPLLQGIASPSVMFNRYTRGWTLAESFYAASRQIGWMGMVIGDPICQAYGEPNQAPVLAASGGSTTFTGLVKVIDNAITVTDVDNTSLALATVAVTAGFHPEDVLTFTGSAATGNIASSFNASIGVLSLTSSGATATVAQWQTALRAITYKNIAAIPNTAARTITFVINDGDKSSIPVTKNIAIAVPVISTTGTLSGLTTTYNKASPAGTFNVSGISLGAGILVTAPTGFEVSKDNVTFSNTITVGSSGTIASTVVHIRLAAGINAGNYSGNVVLSSRGAANVNVATAASTVKKTTLTITANKVNKTYGQVLTGGATTTAFTSAGLAAGQTIGNVTIAYGTGAAADAGVNTYTGSVTASAATGGTFTPANYAITYIAGNIAVNKAVLTITANNKGKPFGQLLTGSAGSTAFTSVGLVNAETIGSVTINYGAGAAANAGVGSYTRSVVASAATGGTFSAANYTITYVAGNLTVGQTILTITANNATKTYGSAVPSLSVSYSGFINSDNASSLTTQPTLSTTAVTNSPVNTYLITVSGAASPNYTIVYNTGQLMVTPAALIITANSATKIYGSVNPALGVSYSGFVGTENAASLITKPVVSTTAVVNSAVGTYPVIASVATSANYSITYKPGTLAITPAALTITANNKAKLYGQALTGDAGSTAFTSSGLVNSETVGSTTITYGTGAAANAAVDTYVGSVVASAATGGTFSPANYHIIYVAGDITVGKVTLTIAANNQSKTYGSANPALTVSYTGFVNGDNSSSLTTQPSVITTATASSGVGTYPIAVSGAAAGSYNIVYTAGTLTVNKASLTITADNKIRIYGVANPTLTATYSGFVNGDTPASLTTPPALKTVAATISEPGIYAIMAGAAVSPNYAISYVAGKLTVKPLSIAGLINLTISPGKLSPVFATGTPAYSTQVENEVDHIQVTLAFDANATARINGTQTPNGSPSYSIPLNVGNNTITVVITAQDGITSATYTISVYRGESQDAVVATNILTPNGDGKNDTWIVKDIELFPNNTVTVFDRGHRIVFTKHGYNNDWNGTYGGSPLTEGTYYYVVDLGPKQRNFKGFITIIRNR